jgi:hypothetical protein
MSLQDSSHPLSAPPAEPQTPKPPVSESKILANRKNSLRSTGPKTLHGKRNVSRNAIKHGIFAREVVITAGDGEESLEEFHALVEGLMNFYQPVGTMEESLVETIVSALWRKARVLRAENGEIRKQLDTSAADRMLRNSDKGNFDLALSEMGLPLCQAENQTGPEGVDDGPAVCHASRPKQFAGTSIRPRIHECTSGAGEIRDSKTTASSRKGFERKSSRFFVSGTTASPSAASPPVQREQV